MWPGLTLQAISWASARLISAIVLRVALRQGLVGSEGLLGDNAVAKDAEGMASGYVFGDPAVGESHHPFNESGVQSAVVKGSGSRPPDGDGPSVDSWLVGAERPAHFQATSFSVSPLWCWVSSFRLDVGLRPCSDVGVGRSLTATPSGSPAPLSVSVLRRRH